MNVIPMENIISYKHKSPSIDPGAYINPYALIIGDVTILEGVSVWPGAIIRADDDRIEIGANTAILDRALVEAPRDKPVSIGENALVSHGAILHGCTLEKGVLVGISATVLDGTLIGEESVISAGTLVPPGTEVPPRSKVMGVPAKVTAKVTDAELEKILEEHGNIRKKAQEYGQWFVAGQM
jgi:carbonic anhydrase/acetyltransferase-like protein (isoleucine patch superfamily)